jgi:hypothetical protein
MLNGVNCSMFSICNLLITCARRGECSQFRVEWARVVSETRGMRKVSFLYYKRQSFQSLFVHSSWVITSSSAQVHWKVRWAPVRPLTPVFSCLTHFQPQWSTSNENLFVDRNPKMNSKLCAPDYPWFPNHNTYVLYSKNPCWNPKAGSAEQRFVFSVMKNSNSSSSSNYLFNKDLKCLLLFHI